MLLFNCHVAGHRHRGIKRGVTMKQTVTSRARVGFAIAIGAAAGVLEAVLANNFETLIRARSTFCLIMAGFGLLIALAGFLIERKSSAPDHPFAFLTSLRYWGTIIVLSTIGLYTFDTLIRTWQVHARPEPEAVHPTIVQAQAVVKFPPLQLEGVVLNGAKSSAVINGQVVFLGEGIGNVLLVSVAANSVEVALDGQTNELTFPKWDPERQ